MRLFPILFLTAAGTAFAAISAQQNPQQDQQGQTPRSSQSSQSSQSGSKKDEAFLATWLLTVNNNEIAASQIAQQRAENPQVKQFAQQMVEEHRQMAQKLQQFTSGAGSSPSVGGQSGQSGSTAQGGDTTGRPSEAGAHMGAGNFDYVGLVTDLGRECQQSVRQELEGKQGAEFDRCYVGIQIGMHMQTVDMLNVFEKYATGELKSTIAEAKPKVEQHLEHAKRLAKSLEGSAGTSGQSGR